MATEVKVPVLPESVSDATIAGWHKKVGDAVSRDENLVDLETDKVVLRGASVDGVIKELKYAEGDTVTSQQVLAVKPPPPPNPAAATSRPRPPVPRSSQADAKAPTTGTRHQAAAGVGRLQPPGPLHRGEGHRSVAGQGTGRRGAVTEPDQLCGRSHRRRRQRASGRARADDCIRKRIAGA